MWTLDNSLGPICRNVVLEQKQSSTAGDGIMEATLGAISHTFLASGW